MTSLVWFRQDLRLRDNPALLHAARRGDIVPVYVLDETLPPRGRPPGGASRWWLHHTLTRLSKALGGLVLARGCPTAIIPALAERTGARGVYWNRSYEPYVGARDAALRDTLSEAGIDVATFNATLLVEPHAVATRDGQPFRVFTPFYRALSAMDIAAPLGCAKPKLAHFEPGDALDSWQLLPTRPNWAKAFEAEWTPGEAGAARRLEHFLDHGLAGYGEGRDRPAQAHISRLSPHLRFGEISPRQVWQAVQHRMKAQPSIRTDAAKFLSEIGWREFAYHLLHHFPKLARDNWRPEFDAYPWQTDDTHLRAWQKGRTGYPFVDAGMRELWATGFMHNRVRMIAASFLTKHLRLHWREGEAWFWDTLVDADLANNAAGWQWVAGSGVDAAPYFRIFNPIEQGRKFDPDGSYVRRWCPELARLPNDMIHAPFEAGPLDLASAGVELGKTYPHPIVDHAHARAAALAGFKVVKSARAAAEQRRARAERQGE